MTAPLEALDETVALVRWLADLFAGPVTPDTLGGPRRRPRQQPDLARLAETVCAAAALGPAAAHAVEAERVRLFVNAPGGVPAPPYASWWLEQTLRGDAAERVAAFLREDGLDVDATAGPADALVVELEYVFFLLQHQKAAIATGQPGLATAAREREAAFIAAHLRPWIGRFAAATRAASRRPEWVAAADLLERVLAAEEHR